MTDFSSPLSDAKEQVQSVYRHAHPWIERLARLGYAATGVVYLSVGALATRTALGTRGQRPDTKGALLLLLRQPLGDLLLSLVALGLVGYSVWRLVQAVVDPDQVGASGRGVSKRLGYALTGLIHAGLAVVAVGMVTGAAWGGNGVEAKGWTARLMALPLGRWAVGLSGVALLSVGLVLLFRAWRIRLDEVLDPHQLSPRTWQCIVYMGRVGGAARGVVFALIGGSLLIAAWQADPRAARGLGEALETLHHQAYGPWLLGLVAVGLGVYWALSHHGRLLSLHPCRRALKCVGDETEISHFRFLWPDVRIPLTERPF